MTPDREQELLLQIAALTAERDQLLQEKEGTRAWLGEWLTGSPIMEKVDPDRAYKTLADALVQQYPDKKIQAIKEMRSRSTIIGPAGHGLGLKEAKDFIDQAHERARQTGMIDTTINPSVIGQL